MSDRQRGAGWRQSSGPGAASGSSRGTRIAIALMSLLAVAGGIAGLWYWIQSPQHVRFITIPVVEYTDPSWPPNSWAERDGDLLLACFPESEKAFAFQEQERLGPLLQSLREEKRPLVIYISSLGHTKGGAVYLLPGHAKPNDVATWTPIEDVLTRFGEMTARHKLLILDISMPIADTFRGPPTDDVSERLHAVLKQKGDQLGGFVLTSCAAGEVSQSLDVEQSTVFGYYLSEGLRGAADGYSGERDGRVTARDIAEFTAARVARWSVNNRGTRQTPTLYGNGPDFPLTFSAQSPAEPPTPMTYPDWLTTGWRERDARRSAEAYRLAPAAAAALDVDLVRAERSWQAGGRDAAQRRLFGDRDEWLKLLDAAKRARRIPVLSLVAALAGKPIPPEITAALEKLHAVRTAAPPAKPEDLTKANEDFVNKAKAARTEGAASVWQHLVRDPEPTQDRIRLAANLFTEMQAIETAETILIRRIGAWRPQAIPWPPQAVHALLQAEDSLGKALILAPSAFPWVAELMAGAESQRRDGEAKLFAAKSLDEVKAAADLLADADRGFRAAARQWAVVQSVRRAAEDSAQLLVSTIDDAVGGSFDEGQWRQAANVSRSLAELLVRSPDGRALPLTEWEGRLEEWKRARAGFDTAYGAERIKAVLAVKNDVAGLRSLIRGPMLGSADRIAVWKGLQSAERQLHEKTVALDRADDETQRKTPVPSASPSVANPANVAARRSRLAAELLSVSGFAGTPSPAVWFTQLPKALADAIAKPDWLTASRLERIPAPGVARPGKSAAASQLFEEEKQCRAWLAAYYSALGAARAEVRGATEICDAAAADLRQAPRD